MTDKKHDYFSYNPGTGIIPEGDFRISASQVSRYFDSTTSWFREFLLGEEGFTGNTATELGTCVHAAAEMFVREGTIHNDAIEEYIENLGNDIDKRFIMSQYPGMASTLLAMYLEQNMPEKTELFLAKEIIPNIWAGGSIDNLTKLPDGTYAIVDYKTTSSKTAPTKVARSYWFQQCLYVWLARHHGYQVNSFRLVYITTNELNRVSEKTGKPLKDYPSTVAVLEHLVTDTDIEIIENTVNLIAESVKAWKEQPEIRHLLAQDYRLKPKPKRKLFVNKN